jgi:hypothetical protein
MPEIELDHEHAWQLTEGGYIRSWHTEIEGDTIRAYYGGSEDWSENGDGRMYLECLQCGVERDLDPSNEVIWK